MKNNKKKMTCNELKLSNWTPTPGYKSRPYEGSDHYNHLNLILPWQWTDYNYATACNQKRPSRECSPYMLVTYTLTINKLKYACLSVCICVRIHIYKPQMSRICFQILFGGSKLTKDLTGQETWPTKALFCPQTPCKGIILPTDTMH